MKLIRFTTIDNLRDEIFKDSLSQFILVQLDDKELSLDTHFLQRMEEVAVDSDASITYCHYREKSGDKITLHPVNDYQFGSVRDDFDFGSVVLLNVADVLAASEGFASEESDSPDGGCSPSADVDRQNYSGTAGISLHCREKGFQEERREAT